MSSAMQVSKRPSQMDKPSPIPHTRVDDETVIESMFQMGRKLGQGSFGVVREALDINSGKKWAVKAVNKEKAGSSAVKLLEREVSILKRVNHDHLIHLEQVFETSKKMYLVMELCEHGELADMLKAQQYFKEGETRQIIRDLASAISYLHKNGIVHRDLKLENILVHKNEESHDLHIKVTDFGLSVVKDGVGHESMMQQFCGTPIYMPPEIVDNKTYSQQCDVWAMGVITYYLLAGSPPFKARDEETLYEYIKKGEINFGEERIKDCSTDAHQCIQGMLKVDPAHRLTASEVLNHHWITGVQNGSSVGNVLELMKQFKDEMNVDDDDEGLDSSTHLHTADSAESKSNNNLLGSKKIKGSTTKISKGMKPRSAGSRPLVSGNLGMGSSTNQFINRQHQHLVASSHTANHRTAQMSNPSVASISPLRTRQSPTRPLQHGTAGLLETPEVNGRDSHSGGSRGSPVVGSSASVTKSNSNIARKKGEKSPPSQLIKAANKK